MEYCVCAWAVRNLLVNENEHSIVSDDFIK